MIYTGPVKCNLCKHWFGDQSCRAYPDGIPNELWSTEHPHRKPHPSDQCYRFEHRRLDFPHLEVLEVKEILCLSCMHYQGKRCCAAFPDEIPIQYWSGEKWHVNAHREDNELQYQPNPDYFHLSERQ